jgi:DNA-binding NtrC family response regulator
VTENHTTVPGPNTFGNRVEPSSLAIRWLFPRLEGRVTLLDRPVLSLGRDAECDVVLEGEQVSRRHAEIRRQGLTFSIVDLGSRNGLFVNGGRIPEAMLGPGMLIRLGEWLGVATIVGRSTPAERQSFQMVLPGYWAGPVLLPLLEPLRRTARSDLPTVIQGETGSGKEGIARAVHTWSGRSGPFLALNCAAVPETLAEGELFGYRKGAFTGAERANPGYLRGAHGGTLFLDEVADLPAALQPKLLRALEQREVLPLGETAPVPIDVRVVVAAQSPLRDAVEAKRFRPDLFARLDGVTIRLPPLRERLEEVPYLFSMILRHRAGGAAVPPLEPPLVESLCLYDWPFNVRELDLLARQMLALHGDAPALRKSMLPERFLAGPSPGPAPIAPAVRSAGPDLETFVAALRTHGGNVKRAAVSLGISRQKAYRLMDAAGELDLDELRRKRSSSGDPE